jgi:hypothetical protein
MVISWVVSTEDAEEGNGRSSLMRYVSVCHISQPTIAVDGIEVCVRVACNHPTGGAPSHNRYHGLGDDDALSHPRHVQTSIGDGVIFLPSHGGKRNVSQRMATAGNDEAKGNGHSSFCTVLLSRLVHSLLRCWIQPPQVSPSEAVLERARV